LDEKEKMFSQKEITLQKQQKDMKTVEKKNREILSESHHEKRFGFEFVFRCYLN
jgi:hypothetical protein